MLTQPEQKKISVLQVHPAHTCASICSRIQPNRCVQQDLLRAAGIRCVEQANVASRGAGHVVLCTGEHRLRHTQMAPHHTRETLARQQPFRSPATSLDQAPGGQVCKCANSVAQLAPNIPEERHSMAQLVPRTPKNRHSLGQTHSAVAGGKLRKVRKAAAALGLQSPVVDVLPAADGARPGVAHKREHCGGAGRRGWVGAQEDGPRNGARSGLKGVGTGTCSAKGHC